VSRIGQIFTVDALAVLPVSRTRTYTEGSNRQTDHIDQDLIRRSRHICVLVIDYLYFGTTAKHCLERICDEDMNADLLASEKQLSVTDLQQFQVERCKPIKNSI
jgi:Arc/MetJ family transcription regulator